MPASLAERLYRAFVGVEAERGARMPEHERAAWNRVVEAAASSLTAPARTSEACREKFASVGYVRPHGDVIEPAALARAIEEYPLDVITNLNMAIQKLQAENEQLTRQRDEAQRAVRDGFPAIVAVIRQQRDEAQALAKEACDLVEAHIVPNRKETLTRVAEIRAALEHKS